MSAHKQQHKLKGRCSEQHVFSPFRCWSLVCSTVCGSIWWTKTQLPLNVFAFIISNLHRKLNETTSGQHHIKPSLHQLIRICLYNLWNRHGDFGSAGFFIFQPKSKDFWAASVAAYVFFMFIKYNVIINSLTLFLVITNQLNILKTIFIFFW